MYAWTVGIKIHPFDVYF